MATSVIGALRVMLGLDSAEFEAGATSAARSAARLQRSIEATGERLTRVGQGLTIGLTAPLASDPEEGGLSDALGFWTEKSMYGRAYMGMVRSTVLVGADGKVAQVWSPVKVKGHAAEVLEAAKAL